MTIRQNHAIVCFLSMALYVKRINVKMVLCPKEQQMGGNVNVLIDGLAKDALCVELTIRQKILV